MTKFAIGQYARVASAGVIFLAARASHAAIDLTATTTELGDVKTAVIAVGVLVLGIAIGVKLYKWVKSAL
jgi:hypothetical protein